MQPPPVCVCSRLSATGAPPVDNTCRALRHVLLAVQVKQSKGAKALHAVPRPAGLLHHTLQHSKGSSHTARTALRYPGPLHPLRCQDCTGLPPCLTSNSTPSMCARLPSHPRPATHLSVLEPSLVELLAGEGADGWVHAVLHIQNVDRVATALQHTAHTHGCCWPARRFEPRTNRDVADAGRPPCAQQPASRPALGERRRHGMATHQRQLSAWSSRVPYL